MRRWSTALLFTIAYLALQPPAMAHQPSFGDNDIKADNPWLIHDPTISTAVYATLETPNDVDYYSFNGNRGQTIFLSITIPQIVGQENFTPIMGLLGPGLPSGNLPKQVTAQTNTGVLILPPANATPFFEPFRRTSYWTRQEQHVTLPDNGSYMVAVWDEEGQVGRYVFVIGEKEVLGGDLAFPFKMGNYWTPFVPQDNA
jgi:hypothetical protein